MISRQILTLSLLRMSFLFECLRYATNVYNFLYSYWTLAQMWYSPPKPTRRYFLSDDDEYDESYLRVPEGAVFIEEWVNEEGNKLCYILYEGEEIVENENPFHLKARSPWVWVGDKETEIDLTRTFNKFLIPGNVIRLDLVQKLIHITENTDLVYIESGTFETKKFPGDGILIEENE